MVSVQCESTNEPLLQENLLNKWFNIIAEKEKKSLGVVTIVLGDDNWLKAINKKYLNHNYFTDVITFDYTTKNIISGDILISLDTVKNNSVKYNTTFINELYRVCVHGLLHLCSYNDITTKEQNLMKEKEDFYLSLL